MVEYERGERFAGKSKYPLKKMLSFTMEGITSLSVKPIRLITGMGICIFLFSIAMLIYSIYRWTIGAAVPGWASVMCSVWAIGGLILLSLGIIGEYIGKIYLEAKGRPRFLIREILDDDRNSGDRNIGNKAVTAGELIGYGVAESLARFALRNFPVTVQKSVSMLVGMVFYTGLNYIAQRFFAFRPTKSEDGDSR